MQLSVDCWIGVLNQDIDVANVAADVAISWLKKLDGKQHTLVALKRSDGAYMMIGGGSSWYVVTLNDGKKDLTLQNPTGLETEMVELCAGGQYGDYPSTICVDQKQAAQAVTLFFEGNEL